MLGYVANIETLTEENTDFRRVLYSGPNLQLVLMSLLPGEQIGAETHANTDQFFRIETGTGRIEIDGLSQAVEPGSCIIVPAGALHNLICSGAESMRIYTIYSPPHHKDHLVQATKAEADGSDECFGGVPSEPILNGAAREFQVKSPMSDRPGKMDLFTTRTGDLFKVRSANPGDAELLTEFFTHVTRADLRFRFLSGMREVGSYNIDLLTHPDHELTESFVVFTEDGKKLVATGMLAFDNELERGEVAIVIRQDYKLKGISWELLAYIARCAEAKGLKTLESIESRENHEAINLERDMGFVAKAYPGDSTLILLSRQLNRHEIDA